ncbi:MAG: FecR domain-containing protein [Gammaproteobacteria bacterium]|nr:FecR domain-containing protein [Gammaproteobacteria bacterium]
MQTAGGLWIGIVLSLCALSVYADSAVRVDALNYPAWLLRNYQTLPLQPGTRLQDDDLIRTGKDGRIQLRLADGSAIRLGESSRFVIRQAALTPVSGDTPVPLSFQALRGVVRVSSAFFDADGPRHRLELKIGAINTTVGKADIWGRADLAQDAVCLVEGELGIEVSSTSSIDMSQALSCFVKPRDQAPLPVDQIDMQQHRLWIAETDLRSEFGIVTENGQWQLVLISLSDAQRAQQVLREFHRQGFAAQDKTVQRNGRILHRLLLAGFDSIDAALSARARLEQQLGVSETWVWKAN